MKPKIISLVSLAIATLALSCSAQSRPGSEPIPSGEETARAAAERTRSAQEADATGLIYATSRDERDAGHDASGQVLGSTQNTLTGEQDFRELEWIAAPSDSAEKDFDPESLEDDWREARNSGIDALKVVLPEDFDHDDLGTLTVLAYTMGFQHIKIERKPIGPMDAASTEDAPPCR